MSSRFRLRYQAIDLNLSTEEFVVGRTTECHLVLDDGLVSRRHASFRVHGDIVAVKDLGSRNGVSVNGAPIQGGTLLQAGDRVRIGSHELVLVDTTVAKSLASEGTAELVRCKNCGAFHEYGKPCSTCDTRNKARGSAVTREEPELQRGASLGSTVLADKAISLGRFEEAERLLSARLLALHAHAVTLAEDERADLRIASAYAVKLAEGLQKPSWLDYPFDLYAAARVLMPADTIDDLYRVAGRVRYSNPHALSRYLGGLRDRQEDWGANERFLLQRLEGLERRFRSG